LPENDKAVLIYSTFPTREAAEEVGIHLVDARLAACVNIIPGMTSIYRWQGERHKDSETVMLIKTRASLAGRVISETKARHPYTNPALLVLPVEGGSEEFIGWLFSETADAAG
jgi:periplasmic divalent cation tolerance protein